MKLPAEQQAIHAKCVHPSGHFIEMPREAVETSIPARFEQMVGEFPGRLAVTTGARSLTYHELNGAANGLAHAVLAQRGEAQEPVALLLEHDCGLFVAMMAVLKAGKMCVVLDPAFPKTRNSFLLEDSQARLLITDRTNLSMARDVAHDRCRVLDVDEMDPTLSIENPALSITSDGLAFLIYTSGSTGQPKGVIQNHRNLLQDSRLYCTGLHVCEEDRAALLYSCSASQGLKVTFATLLNGAALYPYRVQQEGVADLAGWLNQEAITLYFSVPVLFRQFARSLSGHERFPHLRIIQLGSDRVSRGELDLYGKHFSADTVLVVRYGTTETGTLRRMFFDATTRLEHVTVPVGYAIEDADIALLDQEGNQAASGAIGEIVVRSRYISPGYWRRPELTRHAFVSDPNGGEERTYRTGDVGRMRPDGLLDHLGRKDFQLKVRGYSVGAGEIEAVLQEQHNVKEAIVTTVKSSAGLDVERLIAYVVPVDTPPPSIHVLRTEIGQRLPTYMIPSDFIFMESLPRTLNGKIDRGSLPEPGKARPALDVAFVAPQTDVQTELAELWERVLEVRPIGVDDSFFDLGGDSLVAMRLISHVAKRFHVEIPIQFLFQSPTVAAMAALCLPADGVA